MKINQILSERISITQQVLPALEQFLVGIFQKETTQEVNNYRRVLPGTLAPDLNHIEVTDLERMFDKYNFRRYIQQICADVLNVNDPVSVMYGRNDTFGQTALMTDRESGKLIYTLFLNYRDMIPLADAYNANILDKLYDIDVKWMEMADSPNKLSKEQAAQIVDQKDNVIANLFPQQEGFRKFCSVIIHELAHLASENAAFLNYNKNPNKYNISKRAAPHLISQLYRQQKLVYDPETKKGLDSHFSHPAELDSYAQEIATQIQYATERSKTLPVRYIRQQLVKLIQNYRKEVALNLHRLTPQQRKYVYKLYKRVYQEISHIIEHSKKKNK